MNPIVLYVGSFWIFVWFIICFFQEDFVSCRISLMLSYILIVLGLAQKKSLSVPNIKPED